MSTRRNFTVLLIGEQGWRNGESSRLPPMCPEFNSQTRRHTVCGLSLWLVLFLAPRGFSLGTSVYPSPQKPTFSNSNSIWIIVKHFIMSPWLEFSRKHSLCLTLNLHLHLHLYCKFTTRFTSKYVKSQTFMCKAREQYIHLELALFCWLLCYFIMVLFSTSSIDTERQPKTKIQTSSFRRIIGLLGFFF